MSQIEDLLQRCTVKLTLPDRRGWGTGFFVAPGWILTCAHVVREAADSQVTVFYPAQQKTLSAIVKAKADDSKTLDLALVELSEPLPDHPCVLLDEEPVAIGQALYSYGYLESYANAAPVRPVNEGLTGDMPPLLKLQGAQIEHGISGAALLNLKAGKICGMVKETRAANFHLGGGAIPTRVILEQFPQLRELQRAFHGSDRRWVDLITTQPRIDLQHYLQAILANEYYREWQEVYTPTTVEDRRQVPAPETVIASQRRFSSRLKLRAETVKPEKQEQGNLPNGSSEPQERVEQWDVLAGLRNYSAEHVVLIGKPGSGKSTSLERLLWEEAEKALHDNAQIPVLVKLRRFSSTIEGLIRDFLAGHQVTLEIAQIEELLRQGRFLLLLDGLNELPKAFETEVANFRDRYFHTTPMIVSTRDLGGGSTLGIKKMLKMLPLTEPQMREFVRGYLEEEGDQLFRQLQGDGLRRLAETPLLLWMLCRVFAEECIQAEKEERTPKLPENLGLAFREFTQLYDQGTDEEQAIQADAPVDSRDQWPKLLRYLAFVMMQGKTLIDPQLSMLKEEAENCLTVYLQQEGRSNPRDCAERWLKDLLQYHLIQPVIQPNFEVHVEFRHQLIQEYYAAECLLVRIGNLDDYTLKRDYLNYLKWTEPVALMLALVDDEALAVRVVEQALEVDLMLGARLAGEVRTKFQEKTMSCVTQKLHNLPRKTNHLEIEILSKTRSRIALSLLENACGNEDFNIRVSAADALGELAVKEAIPTLIILLKDINFSVRISTIKSLVAIGDPLTLPYLLEALEDENPSVCLEAAESIPKFNCDRDTILKLVNIIEDKNRDYKLRRMASLALSGYKDNVEVVSKVVYLLSHQNPSYRRLAFKMAGNLNDEHVIEKLCENLANKYYFSNAVKALEKIGGSIATRALEGYLGDNDRIARRLAACALGKLGEQKAIPELLNILREKDYQFLADAVYGLGSCCSEEAVPLLKEMLLTIQNTGYAIAQNGYVSKGAITHSLSRIKNSVLVQDLQKAKDSDTFERFAKILAIQDDHKSLPVLKEALQNPNAEFRKAAAYSLALMGFKDGISILMEILETEGNWARWWIDEALTKVNDPETLKPLWDLHKSGKAYVIETIQAIQANCKFYNYEIFHSPPAKPQPTQQPPPATTINIAGDYIAGDKIGHDKILGNKTAAPNATTVKIIETVENYHKSPPRDPPS